MGRTCHVGPALGLAAALALAAPAGAQTWTAAVSTSWNNSGNWNPVGIPNSATADIIFGPTGAGLVNISSSVQARSLTFDSIAGGAYTLNSGAGVTLTGVSAITVTGTISNVQTINLANVAGGSLLVPGSGASALTIDNQAFQTAFTNPRLVIGLNTVIGRTGAGTPGITFLGTGTTQMSGTIDSSITGSLFLGGPGTLVITGTNNATGGTDLTGGTLIADNSTLAASKLPGGALTMRGCTLQMIANATTARNETVGILNLNAGHNVINVQTNNGASATLSLTMAAINRGAGSTADFTAETGGTISTTTSVVNGILGAYATANGGDTWATKSGSAIVGLADAAYTADTFSSGTNTDLTPPTFNIGSSTSTNSLRFRFTYSAGQTLDLGASTLTLQSGGILFTSSGDSRINGGTLATAGELILQIQNGGHVNQISSTISAPGGLTTGGFGTLTLSGNTTGIDGPVNANVGNLRFTAPTSLSALPTINFNDSHVNAFQTLTAEFGDGVNASAGTSIRINAGNTSFANPSPNSRVTLSGVVSSAPGTTRNLRLDGTATSGFNLTGANTFTGAVTLEQGFLGIDADASLGNAANPLILSVGSTTTGGLEFLNGGITVVRPVSIVADTRVISSATDVNTISGVMSGGQNLTKVGTGTLVLSGANTWTGQLLIDGGTVRVATAGNLGSGSNMSVGGTLAVTDNITTSRGVLLGLVDGGPGSGMFDVAAGKTLSLSGTVSNRAGAVGTLVKTGAGTLVLSATSSNYSGGTDVRQGIVQAGVDRSLGAAATPVTVEPNGTLSFASTTATGRTFNLFSGTLDLPPGVTLTFNGATVGGGFLRGAGVYAVTGGTTFAGTSTSTGTTINATGASTFTNFSNSGTMTMTGPAATPAALNGFINQGSGSITVAATSKLSAGDFQTYGTVTINPATITQDFSQTTLMTNTGTGPLYFNGGSRTFLGTPATAVFPNNWPDVNLRGTPTFVAGVDLNGKNAIVAGGLFVNNGYVEDTTSGGGGTATVVADFGSLVKGAGFFQNSVQTINGGKFQAGNSPGMATFGKFVFGPGGVSNYVFAIDDATGTAGPSPDAAGHVSGWGLVRVVAHASGSDYLGDFTWTATSADKLVISLQTLVNPTTVAVDVLGMMDHFDPTGSYIWRAVEWTGSYFGPVDAATLDAATAFDTNGFANPIGGSFGWALNTSDHSLSLTYTPSAVPEPGAFTLTVVAAMAWSVGRARCRRSSRMESVRPIG
jgi:autotransporter-associated beta strand protein